MFFLALFLVLFLEQDYGVEMKIFAAILTLLLPSLLWAQTPQSFFDLSAVSISGKPVHFSSYRGKVVLVVNTASQCGFTPQMKDLQDLYLKYGPQGFVVLAFPSNDFRQEKGDNTEVKAFAEKNYATTFPFFEKAPVTGPEIQPVFKFLTEHKPGLLFKDIGWNFEKFLVSRQGQVLDRWSSITPPSSTKIHQAIEKALKDPL